MKGTTARGSGRGYFFAGTRRQKDQRDTVASLGHTMTTTTTTTVTAILHSCSSRRHRRRRRRLPVSASADADNRPSVSLFSIHQIASSSSAFFSSLPAFPGSGSATVSLSCISRRKQKREREQCIDTCSGAHTHADTQARTHAHTATVKGERAACRTNSSVRVS